MKKIMAILLSLVLAFCFSTLAFATGEEVKVDEAVSSDEFVYTDGADEYSDSTEDMLADIYGEDFAEALENGEADPYALLEAMGMEKSTVIMAMLLLFAILLFIPVLIVLIVFISKNSKLKSKIKNYELTYGVVYDKEVLKDMANIPPQNYNYNPQTFVPQYPVNNAPQQNSDISAFTDALKNETNKENNDGGNL
jgi:hypothetical protein